MKKLLVVFLLLIPACSLAESFKANAELYFHQSHTKQYFQTQIHNTLQNTLDEKKWVSRYRYEMLAEVGEILTWEQMQPYLIKQLQRDFTSQSFDMAKATPAETFIGAGNNPALKVKIQNRIRGIINQHLQQTLIAHFEAFASQLFSKVTRRAKTNKPSAQYELAMLYLHGIGTQKSPWTAVRWFRKAAIQEYEQAQYQMGKMYDQGLGVKKNPTRAMLWYHRASQSGNSQAMFQVGWHFENGIGVPKKLETAAEWYEQATLYDNFCAQQALGILNAKGYGVKKNLNEAKTLLRTAAREALLELNQQNNYLTRYKLAKLASVYQLANHDWKAREQMQTLKPKQRNKIIALIKNINGYCINYKK